MCSLNWRLFGDELVVAFNRDESVLREKARLPKQFKLNETRFLMPIDPTGGGSWITVNDVGVIFCLLNDYQRKMKPTNKELRSRGLLIKELASHSMLKHISSYMLGLKFENYQPFKLMVISKEFQQQFHYNGIELLQSQAPQQVYSSGHPDAAHIIELRQQHADLSNIENKESLVRLHKSHQPTFNKDGAYGICMHRDEAKSQSLSVIVIKRDKLEFDYYDGQPCSADLAFKRELDLQV